MAIYLDKLPYSNAELKTINDALKLLEAHQFFQQLSQQAMAVLLGQLMNRSMDDEQMLRSIREVSIQTATYSTLTEFAVLLNRREL